MTTKLHEATIAPAVTLLDAVITNQVEQLSEHFLKQPQNEIIASTISLLTRMTYNLNGDYAAQIREIDNALNAFRNHISSGEETTPEQIEGIMYGIDLLEQCRSCVVDITGDSYKPAVVNLTYQPTTTTASASALTGIANVLITVARANETYKNIPIPKQIQMFRHELLLHQAEH